MATSDAGAHRVLEAATAADTWLGIALSVSGDLSSVVEADETYLGVPRVLIPGGAGWGVPSGRSVTAVEATAHGDALVDFTPGWIVWWSAATGGSPLFARRLADTTVRTGDSVSVPAATVRLTYTD